jgi:hypothetical protein
VITAESELPDSSSDDHPSAPRVLDRLPSLLHFSNDSGLTLSCVAGGNPRPEVHWSTGEHLTRLSDISSLCQTLPDGRLRLLPFKAADYEQRVHATGYRCVATNQYGITRGKLIQVRGGTYFVACLALLN